MCGLPRTIHPYSWKNAAAPLSSSRSRLPHSFCWWCVLEVLLCFSVRAFSGWEACCLLEPAQKRMKVWAWGLLPEQVYGGPVTVAKAVAVMSGRSVWMFSFVCASLICGHTSQAHLISYINSAGQYKEINNKSQHCTNTDSNRFTIRNQHWTFKLPTRNLTAQDQNRLSA